MRPSYHWVRQVANDEGNDHSDWLRLLPCRGFIFLRNFYFNVYFIHQFMQCGAGVHI